MTIRNERVRQQDQGAYRVQENDLLHLDNAIPRAKRLPSGGHLLIGDRQGTSPITHALRVRG